MRTDPSTDSATALSDQAAAKIADLRSLLDWLERHPRIAEKFYLGTMFALASDVFEWQAMLVELGGFDKSVTDSFLNAQRRFGSITFEVTATRESVCERVKVGERTVAREIYPADVTPIVETVTEDVYEWSCPSSWIEPTT